MNGLAIAEDIAARFTDLTLKDYRDVRARVRGDSMRLGVTYQPDGKAIEVTDLVLVPVVLSPRDIAAIRATVAVLAGIAEHVPAWRAESPMVRALLPLTAGEEEWIADCLVSTRPEDNTAIGRWDLNVVQTGAGNPQIRLFEGNGTAVGGLNYSPASEEVVRQAVNGARARAGAPRARIARIGDLHETLFRHFTALARRRGRRLSAFALLEDREWDAGITEAPYIVKAFRKRGVKAFLADPRDLTVRGDEVCIGRTPLDAVYRNMELRDFSSLEEEGGRLDGMREAFRQKMVLSTLAGEFDHKSLLEVMTLPDVQRAIPAAWRRTVKAVVPWTRLLIERRCEGPHGTPVDLPAYVRSHRAGLVMKPNRECGGDGVTIGRYFTQDKWEKTLTRALKTKGEWVVQEHVTPVEIPVPLEHRGSVHITRRFANCGVITVPGGPYILGRSSSMPVVNVAQGGGIVAVMKTA